ncbi:hypothetical protein MSPP1_000995 [Malassezia sp. CBS 17886]|nr:hypothetical protein MSPP1_000995 [Malassezia sp. CBS 17886]
MAFRRGAVAPPLARLVVRHVHGQTGRGAAGGGKGADPSSRPPPQKLDLWTQQQWSTRTMLTLSTLGFQQGEEHVLAKLAASERGAATTTAAGNAAPTDAAARGDPATFSLADMQRQRNL